LQLKKAEPIDDLPGPDLLGTDLSELFRKGMGVSTTTPIIGRKPQPSRLDKLPAALRPLLSTPLRAIATASITMALVVSLVVVLIMFFSNNNGVTTAVGLGDGSAATEQPKVNGSASNQTDANTQQPDVKNQSKGAENVLNPSNVPPPAPPGPEPLPTEPTPPTPDQTQQPDKAIENPQQPTIPPPETPTPEKPKIESCKNLATSVDLPDITKSGAQENANETIVSLGKIVLPPGETLQLVLLGGVKALKNADSISMQNNLNIPAGQSPLWRIYADTASQENGDPPKRIEIAQLKISGGNLIFNWMPGATSDYAEALKKCGVLAYVQDQQQFVQLCRPRQAEPLVLDLDKGVSEVNLQVGSPPELGNLRVQITDRVGAFPPNLLQPSDILEVQSEGESETTMIFTDPKFANFKVRITAEMNGQKLDLKATAIYEISGQDPKMFKANDALKLLNNLLRQQGPIQKTFENAPEGNPRKKEAAKKLDQMKKQIEFLQDLSGLYQALKGNQGKIHYSVFIQYGRYKVDLFTTQVPVVIPVEVKDAGQNSANKPETEQQPPKKPSKKSPAKKNP
jgi:hypothetical protein